MKKGLALLLVLFVSATALAQQVYRTEFSVFDLREAALKNDHTNTERHIRFVPKHIETVENVEIFGQTVDLPTAWSDFNLYLHVQNCGKAYHVVVNEQLVGSVEDSITPTDFLLSPYLKQGKNEIWLLLQQSNVPELEAGSHKVALLQHSCLGTPMDRGTWKATIHAVTKSRARLSIAQNKKEL